MGRLKIKKAKEKNLIGMKFRYYIDFVILICCCIIAFNIHPSNPTKEENISSNKNTMIYIFHDYEGNEYIMNDYVHGAPSSWDYLFDNEVPNDLKGEKEFTGSISIGEFVDSTGSESFTENTDNQNYSEGIKDNQVSIGEIISDLGIEYQDTENSGLNTNESRNSDALIISIGDSENDSEEDYYTVKEVIVSGDDSSLIIERINNPVDEINSKDKQNDNVGDEVTSFEDNDAELYNDDELPVIKSFASIEKDRILPVLTSWNDLFYSNETVTYVSRSDLDGNAYLTSQNSNASGITIVSDYQSCSTPWGYKIAHGDSVLAYKQIDNAPDICNIERRFCWKGKLSGTYTQQGCAISKNYSYEKREAFSTSNNANNDFKGGTRQNSDGSVTVKDSEIGGSFVFDRPNNMYTDFSESDNIRAEEPGTEQTSRPYPDCTAPRGEKVKHGQFIQAFKHANGFSDAPCEAQIRLCSVGQLMGTYTESTCKTWDTSFIDWVNGSSSRKTYSKEKIERIKKQIKNEQDYYENTRNNAVRSTNSDALDRILYILDQNN